MIEPVCNVCHWISRKRHGVRVSQNEYPARTRSAYKMNHSYTGVRTPMSYGTRNKPNLNYVCGLNDNANEITGAV